MARKKTSKKQQTDFYSEGLNFSDDPEDSFYATSDDEETTTKQKTSDKKEVFGFYLWELAVLIGEVALVIYFALVFLGIVPLL